MPRPGRKRRADSRYAERSGRLAASLRALRERAGMSQEQLAARAQVPLATLRKIETGAVVEPGYFIVLDMLRALGAETGDTAW